MVMSSRCSARCARIGLDRLLPRRPERLAPLALALIAARVVEPAAKLATARQLSEATASHSLGAILGLGEVDEDELSRALDLLGAAQPAIEKALARLKRRFALKRVVLVGDRGMITAPGSKRS